MSSLSLRWYQQEAVDACFDSLIRDPSAAPLIVAPTGSGKSIMLAELVRRAVVEWGGRVALLAHVKELLQQNADKIRQLLPDLDIGINSAGLGSRDTDHQVLVAGIQSVYRSAHMLGTRHLVVVDEAHKIPKAGEGQYRTFLDELRKLCPFSRLVGLTATPYRTEVDGSIVRDGLLNRICYEVPIEPLVKEGFLCGLTSKAARASVNSDRLRINGGEYVGSDMERAFGQLVEAAVDEMVERAEGRNSCLVFCSGVQHAEDVRAALINRGQIAEVVVGNTPPNDRSWILSRFQSGELRWLVNCNVLTTGYDAPNIDLVAVLRATRSAGLFAQMVGRGFRIHPGKQDCLVLDFGENIRRHGPVDSPEYGRHQLGSPIDDRECPECGSFTPRRHDRCQDCGAEFPKGETKQCPECEHEMALNCCFCPSCGQAVLMPNHETSPDEESAILGGSKPLRYEVVEACCSYHTSRKSGLPVLRVDYVLRPLDTEGAIEVPATDWVCLEHDGYAQQQAHSWWQQHSDSPVPTTVEDALVVEQQMGLRMPVRVTAQYEGRWLKLQDREFNEEKPKELIEIHSTSDDPFEDIPF